jgi:hydrogenase/urease accessory protein HupE
MKNAQAVRRALAHLLVVLSIGLVSSAAFAHPGHFEQGKKKHGSGTKHSNTGADSGYQTLFLG